MVESAKKRELGEMVDNSEVQAAAAAREIIDLNVEQLYGELEIRRRMMADDARVAGSRGRSRPSTPSGFKRWPALPR